METFDSEVEEQAAITGYRLSPRQKELWPSACGGASYVSQLAVSLEGEADAATLKAAYGDVLGRHESLRTTFHSVPGMKFPLQVVGEPDAFSWESLDAGAGQAEEICARERRRPFDFERGPLVRAVLVTFAPARRLLVVTASALCADAPTLSLLFEDLCLCYEARATSAELPDAPLQYIEFSEWQNELLEQGETDEGAAPARVSGKAAPAESPTLPFERRPGGEAASEVCVVTKSFGPETAAALAQSADAPDFLLACWQTLLWRLTGRANVTVGRVFDGRRFEELRGVFGLCSKRAPVSSRFAGGLGLPEILEQTRKAVEEAEGADEVLTPEQGEAAHGGGAALPVGFDFNERPAARNVRGLAFSVAATFARHDRYKLELACAAGDGRLHADFRYDSGLFRQEEVEYLAEQFEALVEHAVAEPGAAVSNLRVLTEAQSRRLLEDFNRTETAFPADQCLHQLFERQAEQTPDHVALDADGLRLTYAELNARANRLARHLRSLGVRPGEVVGICLRRSTEMVVALLGVLKAGAAYVPLDPSHPEQRLAFIVEETGAKVLLTVEKLRRETTAARVVLLDSEWETIERQGAENPANLARPEDLTYVLYTSGSTGNPKGVMIPHRGLVNYLSWAAEFYGAEAGLPAPVHSPLGFDLTVTSLFCPLLKGGSVVLIPEDKGVEGLSGALESGGDFSLIKITPSHLELLARLLSNAEAAKRARALVVGGEALPGEALAFWRTHSPQTRVVNEYGPTETVVGCCVYEVRPDDRPAGTVPIGRPIANTRLYILDSRMRPVGAGTEGELYIGGAGVARGYLNRPGLTAESFVPDPFGPEPGARLYRSGDAVRLRLDGELEFVGRYDAQVKIRGFRIELGEIEAALAAHESVREAVVVAREGASGENRLVAYVVAQRGEEAGAPELREYLKQKLPEYMLPAAFVPMTALPLTPNGKVDRRALPDPESVRPELKEVYAAPRNELERTVAAIWREMLHLEKVGVHDNFFDLGGHSLLMVQTHGKLQQALGREIAVIHMFQYPTISTLAEYLSSAEPEQTSFEQSEDRAETRRESARRQRMARRQHLEGAQQ
ncbi:MAG TPA: amino acid adenylation domain-containing protein [Pyrinomonadaceae bacterium]|jgi:amino acid adenylation domain-containing protein|nr:amino acid adenylation domain-containing protein [Pyrinomonadaceae bacterium]